MPHAACRLSRQTMRVQRYQVSLGFSMRRLLAACLVFVAAAVVPASAQTIDVSNDPGGFIGQYDTRWRSRAARGVSVRISGMCASACTILLHHIPREKICVTPAARIGFHTASRFAGTDMMLDYYPADIRAYIFKRGGLSSAMMWMTAPEVYTYFRKC
jgi:hypothetical protein